MAKPRKMPSGVDLRRAASLALMRTQAPAPSENWLALPAATSAARLRRTYLRHAFKRGVGTQSFVAFHHHVARREAAIVTDHRHGGRRRNDLLPEVPAASAAQARTWLRTPYSSMRSRPMP
jgi:hypothetical protein